MSYIIGLDAGGTRTIIEQFTPDMESVGQVERPGVQASLLNAAEVADILVQYVRELAENNNGKLPQKAGCAVAGALPVVRKRIQRQLQTLLPGVQWYVASDAEAAHTGAFNSTQGILVVAGTGAIALTKYRNVFLKCGGFGPYITDPGSGLELGIKTLQYVCKQFDEDKRTSLVKEICNKFDAHTKTALINCIQKAPHCIASLPPILFNTLEKEHTGAMKIAQQGANEIASMTARLLKKVPESHYQIVLHGGLFKSRTYATWVKQNLSAISPKITFLTAQYSPRKGVCLMMENRKY